MFKEKLQRIKLTGQKGLDILFKPAETTLAKWIVPILLVMLFAIGILHWGYILNSFTNRLIWGTGTKSLNLFKYF